MNLDLSYVVIRTHARIADLLNHEQIQRLAESKDVEEFLERLSKTTYGQISIEGTEMVPVALEKAFYEKFLERILEIVDLTPHKMGDFLKTYYYLRFETLNLKRIIRGKFSGISPDKNLASLVPIDPYLIRSYKQLAESVSVSEVVNHLKGTPYSEVASRLNLYEKYDIIWSNIHGLTKMGARVTVAGPSMMMPRGIDKLGVGVSHSINEAIKGADIIMMLRVQFERQKQQIFPSIREYATYFGLNRENVKLAKEDVIVMHPGPVNRGVEIAPDVADGPYSVILDQVTNGVAVRMALLYLLAGGKYETSP